VGQLSATESGSLYTEPSLSTEENEKGSGVTNDPKCFNFFLLNSKIVDMDRLIIE